MTSYRLSSGGKIDRSRPIKFQWAGKTLTGFEGDTLASALLANGISRVGRSFKYHRPRGLIAAGLEEPNGIVQIEHDGRVDVNFKATEVVLREGLSARPVNAWPSLDFDLLAVNQWVKRFIPAAFYYKTFMWPDWHWFEPFIRRAAGLGVAPEAPDADLYTHKHAAIETLIIGGGHSGLQAALEASQKGEEVMLVEHDPLFGGMGRHKAKSGAADEDWIKEAVDTLRLRANVTMLAKTTAIGAYDHNLIGLIERVEGKTSERFWKVRAGRTLFATGAIERPLVFDNNDRPGILLASAAHTYLERFAIVPGQQIVVATNNDSAYHTAIALRQAGVSDITILDARARGDANPSLLSELSDIPVRFEASVRKAIGSGRLRGVEPVRLGKRGEPVENLPRLTCDALLMSGGWSPVVHLFSQAGGKLIYDARRAAFCPDQALPTHTCIGSAAGDLAFQGRVRPLWSMRDPADAPSSKAWVDYQNDVTAADVALAARESFKSVEHLKRYTTLGMATDQGKTSNVNGLAIMGEILGKSPGEVGTTKFRPPYNPTRIGAFAGYRVGETHHPDQILAAHDIHEKNCAAFEDYGRWRRPAYYRQGAESEHQTIAREAEAVRRSVGLFDASSLGTIEVYGPDAGEFLDRVYAGTLSTVKPGRCRYGLMLSEHGIIFDDGVVARRSEDHFLVGATSGNANAVAAHLEEWLQCEWRDLRVATSNVTTHWSTMNLAGPNARNILQKLDSDIDFSNQAFPHLGYREGQLQGVPCRVQRVSFSGELSYEVSVPWAYGGALMECLLDAGEAHNIELFGIEALMTLRIEKGFLHVGSETDGTTLPQDLGYGRMVSRKKKDFIGKRSTMRPDGQRERRRHLVGLRAKDEGVLPLGGHVVEAGDPAPGESQGWVSSSAYSPTLQRGVALGMVTDGRDRLGDTVEIWHLGERQSALIVEPCQFDPDGERMRG